MRGEGNERIARYDGKRLNDLLIRTFVGCGSGVLGLLGKISDGPKDIVTLEIVDTIRDWLIMLSKINRHV